MELKIKIGRKGIITGLILLVVLGIYNVIFFVVPLNKELSAGAFWVTYGFTTLFIIMMAVVVFIGFHDKDLKSRIFGVPIVYLGYSTLMLQFLIDGVVMGVGHFYRIQLWIPLVVELIILAFFLISLIARTAYKSTIASIDAQKERKEYILDLRIQLDSLVEANKIDAIKPELEKLAETVRYTDPVSTKDSVDTEDQITVAFNNLSNSVDTGDIEKAQLSIAKMNRLLNERKAILKKNK